MELIHTKLQNLLNDFLKNNPDGVREIAHEFGVSLLTVKRWGEGINFPHAAMCPAVITYLKKRMKAGL